MYAVNDVVQPFSKASFRFIMENVSVDQILEEGPAQHTPEEKSADRRERESLRPYCGIKHVADDWQVEKQRGRRMHTRKELHEVALEHPYRFVFRRNVQGRFRHRARLVWLIRHRQKLMGRA